MTRRALADVDRERAIMEAVFPEPQAVMDRLVRRLFEQHLQVLPLQAPTVTRTAGRCVACTLQGPPCLNGVMHMDQVITGLHGPFRAAMHAASNAA